MPKSAIAGLYGKHVCHSRYISFPHLNGSPMIQGTWLFGVSAVFQCPEQGLAELGVNTHRLDEYASESYRDEFYSHEHRCY